MNNCTRVGVLSSMLWDEVAGMDLIASYGLGAAPADPETPRCTTVEPHHLNVLLNIFADWCGMRGSSTRFLEMTPVFPGSRTISVERGRDIPVHL